MIELAQTRTIVFRKGPPRLSLTVPPISKSAWLECLGAMTEIEGNVEVGPAVIALLERVAIAVGGYPDTVDDQGLLSKIPWNHRAAYAHALASACEISSDAVSRRNGEKVIRLQSFWGAPENGGTVRHKDLVHVFKVPSIQQILNFRRGFAPAQTVRTDRRERGSGTITRDPLAGRMCSAIYDEFVVRVEGYAFNGAALGNDRDLIVNAMDTYHKVIAAGMLIVG